MIDIPIITCPHCSYNLLSTHDQQACQTATSDLERAMQREAEELNWARTLPYRDLWEIREFLSWKTRAIIAEGLLNANGQSDNRTE